MHMLCMCRIQELKEEMQKAADLLAAQKDEHATVVNNLQVRYTILESKSQ